MVDRTVAGPNPAGRRWVPRRTRLGSVAAGVLPLAVEGALVVAIVLVAAFLRFDDLSRNPPGLHGDEAITGLEGRRILAEGSIGPYSPSALGQPAAPLYVTALSVRLLGDTILAVRAVPAVFGTLTLVALYAFARLAVGVPVALVSAGVLAVLGWHIHFARIGFPLAAWPLVVVVASGALVVATRRDRPGWWALTGALTILGIYVYNAHPLFVVAMGAVVLYHFYQWDLLVPVVAIALYALVMHPLTLVALMAAVTVLLVGERVGERERFTRLLAFGGGSFLVALPMLRFAADERNGYFQHARLYSLFGREEWTSLASASERTGFLVRRYAGFWDRLCCEPRLDYVDGTGLTPLVPWPLLVLATAGLVLALARQRAPWTALGTLVVAIAPLGAVVTVDGFARRTLALAPFLALFAGVGVVELWRSAHRLSVAPRLAVITTLLLLVGFGVYRSLRDEVGRFPDEPITAWIFAEELTGASRFMAGLAPDRHVYFYSERWSVDYESRRFLAPNVSAEDRSVEFGELSFDVDPELGDPVFVFLGEYRELLPEVRARYPGGTTVEVGPLANRTFVAYIAPSA